MLSHDELRTWLLSNASIAAAVATNSKVANDKCIRAERLRQSDRLPAIEILIDDWGLVNDLTGLSGGTQNAVVRFVCVGKSAAEAMTLAGHVIAFAEPFHGATVDGFIDSATVNSVKPDVFPLDDGSDAAEYTAEIAANIWYRSPA